MTGAASSPTPACGSFERSKSVGVVCRLARPGSIHPRQALVVNVNETPGGDDGSERESGRQVDAASEFEPYGVEHAGSLVRGTVDVVALPQTTPVAVTDDAVRAVAVAFREVFRAASGRATVPDPVAAAVDDAVAWTADKLGGETVDVRGELVPAFHRRVAAFHAAYRATPIDGGRPGQ